MTEEVKQGQKLSDFPGRNQKPYGRINCFHLREEHSKVQSGLKCPIVPCALIDSYKPFDEKSIAPVTVKLIYLHQSAMKSINN